MGKERWTVRLYRSKMKYKFYGPYESTNDVLDCIKKLLPDLEPMGYGLLVERLE